MGTDGPFKLLVVPQLLQEQCEFIQKDVLEGVFEQEQFPEWLDYIQDLKDGVGVVCPLKVIYAHHAWRVLLSIDVKPGLIAIQLS
jgi:hypothetical protein